MQHLEVGIEDLQQVNATRSFTSPHGVADVVAAPDGSAFFVALSTRDYDAHPLDYYLEVFRVELTTTR